MATETLKNIIKQFEGLHDGDKKTPHLQPQMDPVGIWTIGWGHAIRVGNRNLRGEADRILALKMFPALTLQQAETLLDSDLTYYIGIVNSLVKSKINQNQRDALTSFVYNIGGGNLSTSTLLKKVNKNPNDTSIREEFNKWVYSSPNPKPLPGLIARRKLEYSIYSK